MLSTPAVDSVCGAQRLKALLAENPFRVPTAHFSPYAPEAHHFFHGLIQFSS